jgi:hypothetical protein
MYDWDTWGAALLAVVIAGLLLMLGLGVLIGHFV